MSIYIRKMSAGILTLMLCMFTIQAYAQVTSDEKGYYDDYKSILQVMKKSMKEAPKTGDPSLDFLNQMIPHHEAAVSMSENIIKYSHNEAVKQLASNIIREQLEGIRKMEVLKSKLEATPKVNKQAEASYLKAYNAIYQKMTTSMEDAQATGNINKAYLQEMILHHEGAIEMARNILKFTQNGELKTIAQNIINTQQKQVTEMKNLLKNM